MPRKQKGNSGRNALRVEARQLLALRELTGDTQWQFSKRVGVTQQAISRWETGKCKPRFETYQGLSLRFGASMDWLTADKGPGPNFSKLPNMVSREEANQESEGAVKEAVSAAVSTLGERIGRLEAELQLARRTALDLQVRLDELQETKKSLPSKLSREPRGKSQNKINPSDNPQKPDKRK